MTSLQKDPVLNGSGACGEERSSLSSFRALVDMLVSLTNTDGDGRIIISKSRSACSGRQGGFLKYVMLTGEKIFSEVKNCFPFLWHLWDLSNQMKGIKHMLTHMMFIYIFMFNLLEPRFLENDNMMMM